MKFILCLFVFTIVLTQTLIAQTLSITNEKAIMVDKLVVNTKDVYPVVEVKKTSHLLVDKRENEVFGEIDKLLVEFTRLLDKEETDEKVIKDLVKQEISKNSDKIKKRMFTELKEFIIENSLDFQLLINLSLKDTYSEKLTVGELKELNTFFSSEKGKSYFVKLEKFILVIIKEKERFEEAKTEIFRDEFSKTALGNKFLNSLIEDFPNSFEKQFDILVKNLNEKDIEEKFLQIITNIIVEIISNKSGEGEIG